MASKNKDFKLNYKEEKTFEQLFTGQRIAVDPTGRVIVSPCSNSIKFTEIESAKQIYDLKVNESDSKDEEEYIITFEYSQNRLIVAYNSGLLRHWSIDIGEETDENAETHLRVDCVLQRTWKSLHAGPISSIKLDSSGTLVATGGSDSSVKIWDIVNNYCTHNLKEAKGVVSTLFFATNFTSETYHLFASGDDYVIHVWNLISSKHVNVLHGHNGKITDIVYSDDDNKLISSSRDKLVIVWNGSTFEKERIIAIYESVESIDLVPRSQLTVLGKKIAKSAPNSVLVTAGESGVLKLWDYQSGNQLYKQEKSLLQVKVSRDTDEEESSESDQYTLISQIIYNAPLDQLIAVSFDKDIIFHNAADLSPLRQLVGHIDEVLDVKLIGEQQTHIAVATNSPKIKVFELSTSNCSILLGHSDIVLNLAVFAQNPYLMASSSKDNSVRVWQFSTDCTSAVCLYQGSGHTHSVTSLCTSMPGTAADKSDLFFLSGSEDTTLKFWKLPEDLQSFEENQLADNNSSQPIVAKFTQSCHEKAINSIDVSPNNQLVATGSQDKTAKLWLLPNLKLVGVVRGHKKGIWHVQFSPVDQVLATCSADSTIKVWSITNFTCLKTFQGHLSSVLKLFFIDNGMQFITSASDGNLKIWNLKSNECVSTFDAHDGKVWALTVSNDEEMLVTGSDDSKIVVWKNITTEVREKEAIKSEEAIQSEQTLQNLLHKKSWLKALRLAIRMDHPLRSLNILKQILLDEGSVEGMVSQLSKLRQDQLLTLLGYSVHWNTNSRHFLVANCVIRAVMEQIPPEELLQMGDFKSKVEKLLPYLERHMARVKRLKQYVTFADFVYEKMKLPDADAVASNFFVD